MKKHYYFKLIVGFLVIACLASFVATPDFNLREITGEEAPDLYGEGYQLRKPAHESFLRMKKDALAAGFDIYSVSSYRSFTDQKRIWNNKYTRFIQEGSSPQEAIAKIIEYSTIPGTSRHHWGTDIDIVDGNKNVSGDRLLAHLFSPGKPYGDLKHWLVENAGKYGFVEVYTNTTGRKGFKYEPWHYSYKPLSQPLLKKYQSIDFTKLLKGLDIHGSKYFSDRFIRKYWNENMMDINPELKPGK